MTDTTRSVIETMERLKCRDHTLKIICLPGNQFTDLALSELIGCLLAYPDAVKCVYLEYNKLTDETGVKLAQYITASSTIQHLNIYNNQFGLITYLALAAALRINSSLQSLHLYRNPKMNQGCADTAFIEALQLNPHRSSGAYWCLYSFCKDDFLRLRNTARQSGHPTLQALLNHELEKKEIKSIKHIL